VGCKPIAGTNWGLNFFRKQVSIIFIFLLSNFWQISPILRNGAVILHEVDFFIKSNCALSWEIVVLSSFKCEFNWLTVSSKPSLEFRKSTLVLIQAAFAFICLDFVCSNSTFVCPNSSFARPSSSFVCPNSSFVCTNSSFVCTHSSLVRLNSSFIRPNSFFTFIIRFSISAGMSSVILITILTIHVAWKSFSSWVSNSTWGSLVIINKLLNSWLPKSITPCPSDIPKNSLSLSQVIIDSPTFPWTTSNIVILWISL